MIRERCVAYFCYFGNTYLMTDWVWDNLERQRNYGVWEGEGLYILRPNKSTGQLESSRPTRLQPHEGCLSFSLIIFKAALGFSCTFKLSFTFLILKGFPHRFLHLISWVFCLFVLLSGFLSFPGTEMQHRGQRSTEHSELPGVHSRWHGVIGCGCPLVTLITPAHLWGCHGPATTTVVSRTRQQK